MTVRIDFNLPRLRRRNPSRCGPAACELKSETYPLPAPWENYYPRLNAADLHSLLCPVRQAIGYWRQDRDQDQSIRAAPKLLSSGASLQ